MKEIFSKIEYYILSIKYYLIFAISEFKKELNYIIERTYYNTGLLVADINVRLFGFINDIKIENQKIFSQIKIFINKNQSKIMVIASIYIGAYFLLYLFKLLFRVHKYKKIITKNKALKETLLKKRIYKLKIIFSKEFYQNLSTDIAKLLTKLLSGYLLALEDKIKNVSFIRDVFYSYRIFKKIIYIPAKILDILGTFIEKGLILVKIIEPKLSEVNLFLSTVDEKSLDKLKTEIPDELKKEFMFQKKGDLDEHFKFSSVYRKPIMTALNKWNEDTLHSMLFIGKRGSGKSALITIITEKFLKNAEIIEIKIEPELFRKHNLNNLLSKITGDVTMAGTVETLRKSNKKYIIILDDIHYLFFREEGNFSRFNELLSMIGNTSGNVLWIATINEYTYDFLAQFTPVNDTFDFKIQLNLLNSQDVKNIFLNKAKKHNYNIYPKLTKEQIKRVKKKIKKGELNYPDLPHYVISEYFGKLIDKCENIFPGLYYYFVRSIVEVMKNRIYVSEINFMELNFVQNFKPEYYFILTTIMLHDTLSVKELSHLLNLEEKKVEVYISFLLKNRILEKTHFKGHNFYYINPIIDFELSKILETKNFLYFN